MKDQNMEKESETRWIVKKSAGLFLLVLCTMPVFWKSAFCFYLLNIPGILENWNRIKENLVVITNLSEYFRKFILL